MGLDQGTLAKRVGVSRLWVSEVERGKPRAEIGLVLRTLRELGISLRVDSDEAPEVDAPSIDAVVDRARGDG
jgi:HTH-type transcriptional regulator/antitoxin HipB